MIYGIRESNRWRYQPSLHHQEWDTRLWHTTDCGSWGSNGFVSNWRMTWSVSESLLWQIKYLWLRPVKDLLMNGFSYFFHPVSISPSHKNDREYSQGWHLWCDLSQWSEGKLLCGWSLLKLVPAPALIYSLEMVTIPTLTTEKCLLSLRICCVHDSKLKAFHILKTTGYNLTLCFCRAETKNSQNCWSKWSLF